MKLKKLFIAFIFSFLLAVSSLDGRYSGNSNRPAIIYQLDKTPDYNRRKKALKAPRFAVRNSI